MAPKRKPPKALEEPPPSRTHNPTRDYEELMEKAIRGVLDQPEITP